uniref:hypothetical protein n=1 Tax=Microbacterium proteolyticum TaxID=1572644 RepID=UPI002415A1D2|nr:hypothetical protein [Microbacterium proteolyticum]
MTLYKVPGIGVVDVTLTEHRFGMTGEIIVLLGEVRRVTGEPVSAEAHERTAQFLHHKGVI